VKAWFLLGPDDMQLRDVPDPEPAPEEALVHVRAVGICGSDAEAFTGRHPLPNYPRLPGHEFAGEVAAVGAAWRGPPVASRVAVDPALHCGRCYACRQGRYNCCADVSIAGVHRPGAMAEYAVCRSSQLHPMPDAMSFETAAVVETLSIGAQAVHRADVERGDRVVLLGAGPIGLCCLIMAHLRGATILISEPLEWRRQLAAQLGAAVCVNPDTASLSDAVAEFTGGSGAHVVIDATGELSAAQSSLDLVGSAARVVILSLCDEPLQVRPWQLVRQELTVLGSRLSLADFGGLIDLVASGQTPIGQLVTHRYSFADAEQAFRAAAGRREGLVKAVVLP
jgi:2-desacetyl-2-hydroxyethyl bacteriochlorophyllide A dehydrogenase